MDGWGAVVFSVAPTVIVGLIFWFVIRSIVRADRTERDAYARIEAEERAKAGLAPRPAGAASSPAPARDGSH